MPEVRVPAGLPPERVDKVLTTLVPGASRVVVQRWLLEGRVLVDGQAVRAKYHVSSGQRIEYDPGPELATSAELDAAVKFEVLYDDAHLIVVNKPARLVVHPARGNLAGTLVNGLLALPGFAAPADPRDPDGQRRPGIVHRIDKDTSGVLVVAKTAAAREGLKAQFAAHTVERLYFAISVGVPKPGRYATLYGRHPSQRVKFSSLVKDGKRAVTHVEILERLGLGCCLIACRLETGRTHQIRVHLWEQAKTPLLADRLYGPKASPAPIAEIASLLGRQALHAGVLGFTHPLTNAKLRFEVPLPDDFQGALSALRAAISTSPSALR